MSMANNSKCPEPSPPGSSSAKRNCQEKQSIPDRGSGVKQEPSLKHQTEYLDGGISSSLPVFLSTGLVIFEIRAIVEFLNTAVTKEEE